MDDWRARILKEFTPNVARLTLAADPDGLLLEEALLEAIRGRGQPADLLHLLLQRHYRGDRLPRVLSERLIHLLRRSGAFDSWPLEAIVPDRDAFFSFLQERWPLFLDRLAGNAGSGTPGANGPVSLALEGSADLPFDHHHVRVYVDNLFVEGMLSAVSHEARDALRGTWAAVGIRFDPQADRARRLDGLMEAVGASIPGPDARHRDWTAFGYRWAELNVLRLETAAPTRSERSARIAELRMGVDRAFLAWAERRYAGLHNQPPDPPVMVHHVPRYLARRLEQGAEDKVALIVVDGLALDQWIVLRDVLADQRPCLRFREGAVFAWVPTITSVSRQAIFAGKPPFYFPSSIRTTDREASLWRQFWADQNVAARAIGYTKGLGDGSLGDVREILSRTDIRALGLVVDKVDRIMHGMELGTAGMHNQVRQWSGEGFMAELLDRLHGDGFAVYLTSDHGNIEANGGGRPSEGAVADVRGERARVYSDEALRSRVHEQFPGAIAWPSIGLPEDYLALLAPARSAFVREGDRVVGHGGASLQEVIVPWIHIEQASA